MAIIQAFSVLLLFIFIFSCGQTPQQKIDAQGLHADSIKNARQIMLNSEEKASLRLDSIRKATQ